MEGNQKRAISPSRNSLPATQTSSSSFLDDHVMSVVISKSKWPASPLLIQRCTHYSFLDIGGNNLCFITRATAKDANLRSAPLRPVKKREKVKKKSTINTAGNYEAAGPSPSSSSSSIYIVHNTDNTDVSVRPPPSPSISDESLIGLLSTGRESE